MKMTDTAREHLERAVAWLDDIVGDITPDTDRIGVARAEIEDALELLDAIFEPADDREVLRMITIGYGGFIDGEHTIEVCGLCENEWRRGEPEHHAPGCLAAPKDAPCEKEGK